MATETFIIDCPWCRAKVAAEVDGVASKVIPAGGEDFPSGLKLLVGTCPMCQAPLAGESRQTAWEAEGAEWDQWSDVVRVYPKPARTFSSARIPEVLRDSLREANICIQSGAYTAATTMCGRALEALCRDVLAANSSAAAPAGDASGQQRPMLLAEGIKRLKDGNFIDERLYDWSRQLHAFRNQAAHPGESKISREDAEDLQTFVYAIVEFIYDLKDRYEEFKARLARRESKH